MRIFSEGKIRFLAEDNQRRNANVFYNPVRVNERDLNVLFLRSLGVKGIIGLDVFGASGVRGLRLAAETGCFRYIVINDIKTSKIITRNIALNGLGKICSPSDKNAFQMTSLGRFDYVDIDPFGSPIKFLPDAIESTNFGGVIAITATDTAALYGKANRACYERYGSKSFKTTYFNEVGLRILIKRSEEIANIYGLSILPLFFDVRRHYVRVYLRLSRMDRNHSIGFIYQCSRCPNRTLSPTDKCSYCGSNMVKIGPLWLGKLFDRDVVRSMYRLASKESSEYVDYLLQFFKEADIPTYYTTDSIASLIGENEKKIGLFKNRTIFNPKGFRREGDFEDVIKYYRSIG